MWDLVRVNKLCGGEVIVRDLAARGRVLTGDDSTVEVTRLQSLMSLLDEPPQPTAELAALHHLLFEVKGFAGSSTEEVSLVMYLVSKPQHAKASSLSECFSVDIPAGGSMGNLALGSSTRTLFTDLSAQDMGDGPSADSELYLVVKALALQQIAAPKALSRSDTVTENTHSRDHPKSALISGAKASRRSLMWGGGKTRRPTFSRGHVASRMDSVSG